MSGIEKQLLVLQHTEGQLYMVASFGSKGAHCLMAPLKNMMKTAHLSFAISLPPGTHAQTQTLICTYNLTDVDSISNVLGIPWEPSKDIPFSSTPTFIGFTWDIEQQTVSLAEAKQHKYVAALQAWSEKRAHSLHEVQKLLSKLMHATQIFPKGQLHLANLEAMLTIFGHKPFVPHTPPKGTQDDIVWWTKCLTEQAPPAPIPTLRAPTDVCAFSDASSTIGIGIHIQG